MKKLLLIFTIMLTFSITTVSVSAAELTPSTTITNIISTEFLSDSDSNNLADNVDTSSFGVVNLSYENSVQTFTATQTYGALQFSEIAGKVIGSTGDIYYISTVITSSSADVGIHLDGTKVLTHSGNGKAQRLSLVHESTSTGIEFRISDYSTSGWTEISFTDPMVINLTVLYGANNEPTLIEFEELLKVDSFYGSVLADEVLSFDNNTRIDHYMYDVPDIFEDFPTNVTMENIIRIAFFIPLMIIFYLLIPLFNFVLGGTASGSIMLGLLILAFILREVIRFIDPDFHLFGKNSYYEGFKSPKGKD